LANPGNLAAKEPIVQSLALARGGADVAETPAALRPLGRTSRSPQTFSIPLSALIAIRGKAAILYSDFSILTQGPLSQGGDFVLSSTAAPDHNGQQSNPDGSPLCG
jgi:hypothetical protein